MRLPGIKLAQRTVRRLRSRMAGGIVVLGYHRLGADAGPLGLTVARDRFAAHLDYVARRTNPMRLTDAVQAIAEGRHVRRGVVITFDDGYSDLCDEVLPLLERGAVPATVFVTTGYAGRPFWWDELAATLLSDRTDLPERLEVTIGGRVRSWTLRAGDSRARRRVVRAISDALCALTPAERENVLDAVRTRTGGVPVDFSGGPRALTHGEIRRLAASPCMEIGAHTVSHPMLTALSAADQRREAVQSRRDLEHTIGMAVTMFSYPHGAHSAATRAVVADAGFALACCSMPDALRRGCDPLAVPRLWVDDLDGQAFGRWLEGWLAA